MTVTTNLTEYQQILANPLESWLDDWFHPGGTSRQRRQRQRKRDNRRQTIRAQLGGAHLGSYLNRVSAPEATRDTVGTSPDVSGGDEWQADHRHTDLGYGTTIPLDTCPEVHGQA